MSLRPYISLVKRTILIFGALAASVALLFQLSKFTLGSSSIDRELVLIVVAVLFVVVGYILSRFFRKSVGEHTEIDERALARTGLSDREYEILKLISNGLSNHEIGEELFISESTVKSHVSNILVKLNARRRTQAVQIARDKSLI